MRIIVQRVIEASVSVNKELVSAIGNGMLLLVGFTPTDTIQLTEKLAGKVLKLRLWKELAQKDKSDKEKIKKSEKVEVKQEKEEEKINEKKEIDDNKDDSRREWRTNVIDNNYEILVVSQFTLYGKLKQNKPDFHSASKADDAKKLYEIFINKLQLGYNKDKIKGGAFQQYMNVSLVNDGPVTLIYDENEDEKIIDNKKKK